MLLDLGHAAEDTGPLPNHESRKPLSMETPGLANARRTFVSLLAAALLAAALLRPSSPWRQTGRAPAWPS